MADLWLPGVSGPHDELVSRLHQQIERFAREQEVERAVVEVELADESRLKLDGISPEPGFGFVTLKPCASSDEELPGEMVVPLGMLRRIELYARADDAERFGFSLPSAAGEPPVSATEST